MISSLFGTAAPPESPTEGQLHKSTTSDTSSEEDSFTSDDECLLSRYAASNVGKEQFAKFKTAFGADEDDLITKLDEYVQYRFRYELDSPENAQAIEANDDAADWQWASQIAVDAARTCKDELIPGLEGLPFEDRVCKYDTLPQLCFAHKQPDGTPVCTKDGVPVIQYLSARLDLDAVSPEIHALCIALYLERKAKQNSIDTKGSILLVDVRQGKGWPNHNVLKVVGFLRTLTDALHKIHPGRMTKLIISPVPWSCSYVFGMLKGWLPTSIADNIVLVGGSDGVNDPPPRQELSQYVTDDFIDQMEATRQAGFSS